MLTLTKLLATASVIATTVQGGMMSGNVGGDSMMGGGNPGQAPSPSGNGMNMNGDTDDQSQNINDGSMVGGGGFDGSAGGNHGLAPSSAHNIMDGDMDPSMDHGDMEHEDMDHGDNINDGGAAPSPAIRGSGSGHGDMEHGDMEHGDMEHGDMEHEDNINDGSGSGPCTGMEEEVRQAFTHQKFDIIQSNACRDCLQSPENNGCGLVDSDGSLQALANSASNNDNSNGGDGSQYCGPGTSFDAASGQCHATYEGLITACEQERGDWGWTCKNIAEPCDDGK